MDPDTVLAVLPPAAALLAANAFFVIAEIALLGYPRARPEPGVRESERRSSAPTRLEEMLLTAQLGSSTATLGLGFLLAQALRPAAAGMLSEAGVVALSLAAAAVAHATLATQLPKVVAGQLVGARSAPALTAPIRVLSLVLRPLVWPLSYLLAALARFLGVSATGLRPLLHTPEEIRHLVAQGHEQGVVEEDEREMIHSVFEFTETVAREVMTPRIDIIAVPVDIALDALIDVVAEEGHSRLPVYEGTIDTVVGVLLAKDLFPLLADPRHRERPFDLRAVMREPYFVPDTKPVDDILAEFQSQGVHLAIVLDEFGGTYGLVTMEDLLEELVGDINDEHDVGEETEPEFFPTPEGDVLIDGGASISEVNERFGLGLSEEDFDTVGGFVFGALGRVPSPGDVVGGLGEGQLLVLHVEETEDRRVSRLRLTRAAALEASAALEQPR